MKKNFKLIMLIIAISSFMITGCTLNPLITGSDTMTEEEMDITDFNSIDISHSFTADIIQSDQYKVIVSYNSNLKEYLEIDKNGKSLKIGLENNHQYRNLRLSVKIFMPDINELSVSGASKINIPVFKTNNLKINLSGASVIMAKLVVMNNLKIESSGASNISLAGTVKNAELSFSGASELKGKGMLVSNDLNIESSGASNITITADGNISIEISGASEVNYYGNGKIIKSNSSGASTIKKIESDSEL